jgi:hypothetical protein
VLIDKNPAPLVALGPVTHRTALLDVLRGLAILGILFVNISAFSGWVFLDPQRAAALPASVVGACTKGDFRLECRRAEMGFFANVIRLAHNTSTAED